jgi:hypothetical protein
MGFDFRGCFVRTKDSPHAQTLLEEARSRWPFCQAKAIREPFLGIGISIPDPSAQLPDDAADADYAQELRRLDALHDELPSWSRQHPEDVFVFVRAECFGGVCSYDGYACRNGATVELVPSAKEALRQLLHHLGVALDARQFFEPLTRGYFDDA